MRDIVMSANTNTETWNDCPDCGKVWKDRKPTPGVIHRTINCGCKKEKDNS